MPRDNDFVFSLQSRLEDLGQHYTCLPIQGHSDTASIETPFRLPNGDKINLHVDGRSGGLILSSDDSVVNFLLLLCAGEPFLPLHLYAWIVTIRTEQRVKEEKGRFVIQLEQDDDLIGAINRMISLLLSVVALRYLLVSP